MQSGQTNKKIETGKKQEYPSDQSGALLYQENLLDISNTLRSPMHKRISWHEEHYKYENVQTNKQTTKYIDKENQENSTRVQSCCIEKTCWT